MKLLQTLEINDTSRPFILQLLNTIIYSSVLIYLYLDLTDNTSQGVFLDIILLHQLYLKSLQNFYIEFIDEKTKPNNMSVDIFKGYLEILNLADLSKTKNLDSLYTAFKVRIFSLNKLYRLWSLILR